MSNEQSNFIILGAVAFGVLFLAWFALWGNHQRETATTPFEINSPQVTPPPHTDYLPNGSLNDKG